MIDKGRSGEFGQDTGVTPLLFTRSAMGFFNDHREDLGLTSHLKDLPPIMEPVTAPTRREVVRIH